MLVLLAIEHVTVVTPSHFVNGKGWVTAFAQEAKRQLLNKKKKGKIFYAEKQKRNDSKRKGRATVQSWCNRKALWCERMREWAKEIAKTHWTRKKDGKIIWILIKVLQLKVLTRGSTSSLAFPVLTLTLCPQWFWRMGKGKKKMRRRRRMSPFLYNGMKTFQSLCSSRCVFFLRVASFFLRFVSFLLHIIIYKV